MLQKRNGSTIRIRLLPKKDLMSMSLGKIKAPVIIRKTGTQNRDKLLRMLPIIQWEIGTRANFSHKGAHT
jgi:hypothetical protein